MQSLEEKKKLQRVENNGGRTKLIKKEEEEEEDRKYVRGKNHILLERERGCGCGARS